MSIDIIHNFRLILSNASIVNAYGSKQRDQENRNEEIS